MLNRRNIEVFVTLSYCYGIREGPDGKAEAWDGVLIGAFNREGAERELARLFPDELIEVKTVNLDTDCYSMDLEDFITISMNTTEEN